MSKYDEIPHILTHNVAQLTDQQIARTWFNHTDQPRKFALQYLRRLEKGGMVQVESVMSRKELPLDAPLLRWNPCDEAPVPDFAKLAYQVQRRWDKAYVESVNLVRATKEARQLLGGPLRARRRIRTAEITHNIHLSAAFLRIRHTHPDLAQRFVAEDGLPTRGLGKVADALMQTDDGPVVIEFAGSYNQYRLADIHRTFSRDRYELW